MTYEGLILDINKKKRRKTQVIKLQRTFSLKYYFFSFWK